MLILSLISCWISIEKGTIWAFMAPVMLIMMVSNISKSTCSSYCYLHSGMFMAGQYSVPDNGAGGVGKEGQVKIV